MRPEGAVAVGVADAPEVLEPAARLPERVALDIEEEIAGRGRRQQREAARRLGREQAVDVLAGARVVELELSLLAQRVEGRGRHPGRTVVFSASASSVSVVMSTAASLAIWSRRRPATRSGWSSRSHCASQSGRKSQSGQCGTGSGYDVEPGLDEGDEPLADAAVVGGEVVKAGTSRARRSRARRASARARAPGCARPARSRSRAGGCSSASQCRASLVSATS